MLDLESMDVSLCSVEDALKNSAAMSAEKDHARPVKPSAKQTFSQRAEDITRAKDMPVKVAVGEKAAALKGTSRSSLHHSLTRTPEVSSRETFKEMNLASDLYLDLNNNNSDMGSHSLGTPLAQKETPAVPGPPAPSSPQRTISPLPAGAPYPSILSDLSALLSLPASPINSRAPSPPTVQYVSPPSERPRSPGPSVTVPALAHLNHVAFPPLPSEWPNSRSPSVTVPAPVHSNRVASPPSSRHHSSLPNYRVIVQSPRTRT